MSVEPESIRVKNLIIAEEFSVSEIIGNSEIREIVRDRSLFERAEALR